MNIIFNSKFKIKDIFKEYWDSFLEHLPNLKIRDVVHNEVEKILLCKSFKLGYTLYECPNCNETIFIPHTCKSRFCSSCGVSYIKSRIINSKHKILKCNHRHIVFTIPESLRNIFLENRKLLNLLFDSVNETFTWMFNPVSYKNKQNKKHYTKRSKKIIRVKTDSCLVPGFISVLHTYGRNLKWNPHIHVLISEGALTNSSFKFKKITHFNYETLRKTFQKILLDKLYNHFGKSFYNTKCALYASNKNGFYVYAHPRQFKNLEKGIEYVLRYAGKPAMAESRITNIDYDNDTISYWYEDHTTKKRIDVTEHVYSFISKLIRHIPDENFKMIRYYGIYAAKNHKYQKFYNRMYLNEQIKELKSLNNWRCNSIASFNYDPLLCKCGHIMKIYAIYIPINLKEGEWYEIKKGREKERIHINWEHQFGYDPENDRRRNQVCYPIFQRT